MALRIIRKSSSQSQVELIKGSAEAKAVFSLLTCIDSPAALAALKALLAHEGLQTAEVLLYKTHDYAEQIRAELTGLTQSVKLINESKPGSWSLRLRTLLQEAGTEYCLFLPFQIAADPMPALQAGLTALQQDPSLGMAGPVFVSDDQVLAAGQELAASLPAHVLAWPSNDGESEKAYAPQDRELFYLYQDLPVSLWQPASPTQVSGLPLPLAAIRREAYLALTWADQDWNLPWLAQDLALGLRQKQYRLALLPETVSLVKGPEQQDQGQTVSETDAKAAEQTDSQAADGSVAAAQAPAGESDWLAAGEIPASFREKWLPLLRQVVFTLYRHHGWQQTGLRFSAPARFEGAQARIRDYVQKG